jgi:hypothetical protein
VNVFYKITITKGRDGNPNLVCFWEYSRSIYPFNVFESQILKKKNWGEQLNFDLNLVKKALN